MISIIKKILCKIYKIIVFPPNIYNAYKTIQDIQKMKTEANDTVIVLLKGIGDTVYGLAFIEEIKKLNKSSNIIVIGNIAQQSLIETYKDIYRFVPYDVGKGEYQKYKNYLEVGRVFDLGCGKGIYNTDPYSKYSYYKNCKDNSAIYILRDRIFQLGSDAHITYPSIKGYKINSIPEFENNCKNIVVINPYTNSYSTSTLELFKDISSYLTKRGFLVYTNLVSGQKSIEGTNPLYCSINELTCIIEKSAAFVSIRSGVVDMVINTGTPILVVYNACTKRFRDIYSLSAWQGKSNTKELYLNKYNYDTIISQAKEWCDKVLKTEESSK